MKVTLMGPSDEGYFVLSDYNGNDFPLVEKWADHIPAAKLLGWKPSSSDEQSNETTEEAIEFLTENSGEDFVAPSHVVQYFEEL